MTSNTFSPVASPPPENLTFTGNEERWLFIPCCCSDTLNSEVTKSAAGRQNPLTRSTFRIALILGPLLWLGTRSVAGNVVNGVVWFCASVTAGALRRDELHQFVSQPRSPQPCHHMAQISGRRLPLPAEWEPLDSRLLGFPGQIEHGFSAPCNTWWSNIRFLFLEDVNSIKLLKQKVVIVAKGLLIGLTQWAPSTTNWPYDGQIGTFVVWEDYVSIYSDFLDILPSVCERGGQTFWLVTMGCKTRICFGEPMPGIWVTLITLVNFWGNFFKP